MMPRRREKAFKLIYSKLMEEFGPQHWWPGRTKLEIVVGAILTQNTNWRNVEKAIRQLRKARKLNAASLKDISAAQLAGLIRPAGYFTVKARRLKNFIHFLYSEYGGRISAMEKEPLPVLREKLLNVNGIGPETADSILLYAFDRPVFVVDAYTKRILYRHNLAGRKDTYDEIQRKFLDALPRDVRLFNEYHALIVQTGKLYCKSAAACENCPLNEVHFSMKEKCHSCHRAFINGEQKRKVINGSVSQALLCEFCDSTSFSKPARNS